MLLECLLLFRSQFSEEKIVHVVGIFSYGIELFHRLGRSGIGPLRIGQLIGILLGVGGDVPTYFSKIGKDTGLVPGEVRQKVPDVEVVLAPNGPGKVEHFVDPVAEAINEVFLLRREGAEKDLPLHVIGNGKPEQRESRRRIIHEGHKTIDRLSRLCGGEMLILLGEADHERDFHPRIMQESLVTRHPGTMIGVEKDDRIFGKTVLFELGQQLPYLLIHRGHAIIVTRQRFPNGLGVGVVGRDFDLGRIMDLFSRERGLNVLLEGLVGPDHGSRLM